MSDGRTIIGRTTAPSGSRPLRVLIVIGTRPEAIKLFPVVRELSSDARFEALVVTTGQHREMVDEILGPLGLEPYARLEPVRTGTSLNELTAALLPLVDALIDRSAPDVVMVQGDTTSGFVAALAAFHRRVRVAHVEAGLRSGDRFHPYPEESNRRMISAVTDLHLAPTPASAANLLGEGVERRDIVITGNTAVDSLLAVLDGEVDAGAPTSSPPRADMQLVGDGRLVLITVHRRESWLAGEGAERRPIDAIFAALRRAATAHPQVDFIYPVHRNPLVIATARDALGGLPNLHLVEPFPYFLFVHWLARADLVLSDSGGIQEEAPSLGIPVLVLRETTERPEGLSCGNRLVGTDEAEIVRAVDEVLGAGASRSDAGREAEFQRRRSPALPEGGSVFGSGAERCRPNPYGDGRAAPRIRDALLHAFASGERPIEFFPSVFDPPSTSGVASLEVRVP